MGGTPFSRVKLNAREIALTTDQLRVEALSSRELQNVLAAGGAQADGTPITAYLKKADLSSTSGFSMSISDGDAMFYYSSDSTLTVDDSPYEVLRWRSAPALTFANPSGANPRIDLVIVTPGSVDADSVSRNILIDPVLRTIAPQNVFKTTNPAATISIVTGTAAATPVPPSVPAGSAALFEVYIPTSASNSTFFKVVPRMFRRAPFPYSTMSGVIAGFGLAWDLAPDPGTTASTVGMRAGTNKIVIDGEVMEFTGLVSVFQDAGANDPFAAAAGSSDKPYFIYAVGGRHCPHAEYILGGLGCPVQLVESLVIPNLGNYGRPTTAITTPRGTTTIDGAVYVGLGFVVGGTTRRRACIMTDDMTYIVGGDFGGSVGLTFSGSTSVALAALTSRPAISFRMVAAISTAGVAGHTANFYPDRGDGGGPAPGAIGAGSAFSPGAATIWAASVTGFVVCPIVLNPFNPKLWARGTSGDAISVVPQGWEHRVGRLGGVS